MSNSNLEQSDTYLLARDEQASARLTFQHFALKTRQGWLLHPNVKASIADSPNPRIADLATGNAIWAYEVARDLPHAQVVGLDISPAQYPPRNTWPGNVDLGVLGFLDPVPEKYRGYFDVVHVRIVAAAVYDMDKDLVMANLLAMVKPGGMVQWDELNWPTWWTVDKDLNVGTHMHRAIERMFVHSPFSDATKWAESLPAFFESSGMLDVTAFKPDMIPSNLPWESQSMAWSVREIIGFAVARGIEGAREQLEGANRDIADGLRDGERWCYSWLVTVGRKPA